MKKYLLIVFLALPIAAHADVSSEAFCFTSGGAKPTNFEMHTYYNASVNFSSGFIKYQNSKDMIPLVFADSTTETLSKDTPDEATTTWLEVFGGQVTGEYEMTSQGTSVVSMTYTSRKRRGKKGFLLNADMIEDGSCKWQYAKQ